jgi:hypothetical protein
MKKLEELLNLPDHKDDVKKVEREIKSQAKLVPQIDDIDDTISQVDKVSASLPRVDGLGSASDKELDELSSKATDAYENLMDLGMNTEIRYSGKIFEVAAAMLKNAIDAKSVKLDKKLKIIDLQLKKQKLEMEKNQAKPDESDPLDMTGYIVADRNSIMEKIKKLK